jgi:hypothetical protein
MCGKTEEHKSILMVTIDPLIEEFSDFGHDFGRNNEYSRVKNMLLGEIFVVERQMIIVDQIKYPSFSFENRNDIYL